MLYTGRYGALWEVLPTIESLLKDIKIFVDRYSPVMNTSVLDYSKHWNPIKDRYLLQQPPARMGKA
jgi:hypothetical protein